MRLREIMMLKATVLPSWIRQRMKERKEVVRTALKGIFWLYLTYEVGGISVERVGVLNSELLWRSSDVLVFRHLVQTPKLLWRWWLER